MLRPTCESQSSFAVAEAYDRRWNYATLRERRYRRILFDDLERSALAVTRGGAVQHRANGVNGLAVAADDPADVALTQLDFEDRHLAAWNFREDHVVRKFNQLANDELEKLFHAGRKTNHEQTLMDTKFFRAVWIVDLSSLVFLQALLRQLPRPARLRSRLEAPGQQEPRPPPQEQEPLQSLAQLLPLLLSSLPSRRPSSLPLPDFCFS